MLFKEYAAVLLALAAMTTGCDLKVGDREIAAADSDTSSAEETMRSGPRPLENDRRPITQSGNEMASEPSDIEPGRFMPPPASVKRVELVEAGQGSPGREFTSIAACERAKEALAKHDKETCDPRALLCLPYQRTCVSLD